MAFFFTFKYQFFRTSTKKLNLTIEKCFDMREVLNYKMKSFISTFIIILAAAIVATAQIGKSNDAIDKQIKTLKADKNISLSYNDDGGTSKVFAVGEDFGKDQDDRAGLRNFNFGMAFFYAGKSLAAAPETIKWTFWAYYSKKPRFPDAHNLKITVDGETLDLGDAGYVVRMNEGREFLNFAVSRENLAKIAKGSKATMKIGASEFSFTPEQMRTFANIIKISDPKISQ